MEYSVIANLSIVPVKDDFRQPKFKVDKNTLITLIEDEFLKTFISKYENFNNYDRIINKIVRISTCVNNKIQSSIFSHSYNQNTPVKFKIKIKVTHDIPMVTVADIKLYSSNLDELTLINPILKYNDDFGKNTIVEVKSMIMSNDVLVQGDIGNLNIIKSDSENKLFKNSIEMFDKIKSNIKNKLYFDCQRVVDFAYCIKSDGNNDLITFVVNGHCYTITQDNLQNMYDRFELLIKLGDSK